jgi:hypothetical protein
MIILRVVMLSLGFILLSPFAEPARALSPEWTRCFNEGNAFAADVQIGGCTAVIQSGTEPQNNRVIAHTYRADAYRTRGDNDRAIAGRSPTTPRRLS